MENSLTRENLLRKLPELEEIKTESLREETINAFLKICPDYFWEVPASSTGKFHHIDHRGKHGLWIHTKRAATIYNRQSESYVNQGLIDKFERDCGRSAILLHDIYKYAYPKKEHTVPNHDIIAGKKLKRTTELPRKVIGCVESHNGPWYEGRSPQTDLEHVHHIADLTASSSDISAAVLQPVDKLTDIMKDPSTRTRI